MTIAEGPCGNRKIQQKKQVNIFSLKMVIVQKCEKSQEFSELKVTLSFFQHIGTHLHQGNDPRLI